MLINNEHKTHFFQSFIGGTRLFSELILKVTGYTIKLR